MTGNLNMGGHDILDVGALNLPDDGWGSDALKFKTLKIIEVAGALRLVLHDESAYADVYVKNITFTTDLIQEASSAFMDLRPSNSDGKGELRLRNWTGAAWQTAARMGTRGSYDPTFYIPRAGDIIHLTGAFHHTLPDTRPAAPTAGDVRYNATSKELEVYDGSAWHNHSKIKTGRYTGDDTTSQAITGVGFQPKYVRIWPSTTVAGTSSQFFEVTDTMNAGFCAEHGVAIGFMHIIQKANAVISLDADGFTIDDGGINAHPNKYDHLYDYLCLG